MIAVVVAFIGLLLPFTSLKMKDSEAGYMLDDIGLGEVEDESENAFDFCDDLGDIGDKGTLFLIVGIVGAVIVIVCHLLRKNTIALVGVALMAAFAVMMVIYMGSALGDAVRYFVGLEELGLGMTSEMEAMIDEYVAEINSMASFQPGIGFFVYAIGTVASGVFSLVKIR